jgi:hypothetical protein
MNGPDAGTDVEHARTLDALAPDDLDQLPCRQVQLAVAPTCQIGVCTKAVVCEALEILVAAEPTPRL